MHRELLAGDTLQQCVVQYGDVGTRIGPRRVDCELCNESRVEVPVGVEVRGEVNVAPVQLVVYALCVKEVGETQFIII